MLEPKVEVLTVDEVEAAVTGNTCAVCLTWVHSFSGRLLDLDGGWSRLPRSRGLVHRQRIAGGWRDAPIDVRSVPVDALVSADFKWLCGPYGTALCWLRPELFETLRPTKLYVAIWRGVSTTSIA